MSPTATLQVTQRAAREIRQASAWWTAHRPQAPKAFSEEIKKAFELLQRQPLIGAPALDEDLPGVRRLHLRRIRYDLYYRSNENPSLVEILALWHTSRGSGPGLR